MELEILDIKVDTGLTVKNIERFSNEVSVKRTCPD